MHSGLSLMRVGIIVPFSIPPFGLCIFLSRRRSSICSVSSVMPRNVIMDAGPSVLSVACESMLSSAAAHSGVAGGPIVIKSSR